MPIDILKNMGQDIVFSDYIEIYMEDGNNIIFNPFYSREKDSLYLQCEDMKIVKRIFINDNKFHLIFFDGEVKSFDEKIIHINIEDGRFKRLIGTGLLGNLIQCSVQDAVLYNLDVTRAFPEEVINNVKKRIK